MNSYLRDAGKRFAVLIEGRGIADASGLTENALSAGEFEPVVIANERFTIAIVRRLNRRIRSRISMLLL